MTTEAIVADGIAKHFGDVEALKGVSFAVPEGSVLGLLGPNGPGKTTAVRVLTTLLAPDAGKATVLGHDVRADAQIVRASIEVQPPPRCGVLRQGDAVTRPAREVLASDRIEP
ncbi:MAG: ATP-binding cassette domain-containing protein [Actinobacteria bacterium]|nr:ATP-binding cassette domain-containing protein [Actinomycetota bacterium]